MANENDDKLREYLNSLIEGMRPKLLDLTRRNPLLSTPFSERSHSNIRVVDEVPSFLFEKLLTDRMRLVPLPPLEEDPKDELSQEFRTAFAKARYTDEEYLQKLEVLETDDDDNEQRLLSYDRELKDKVRAILGLPERQTKTQLSLKKHAKIHNINPSHELNPDLKGDDGRYTDNDIQTLLLPDLFERRLNSISSKIKTWQQETGISVFHIAFGFLEWSDSNTSKSSFAPLLLMPAALEKERTRSGVEFYITSEGENVEENVVLAEKLRIDYAIAFPAFNQEESIEDYFSTIENSIPKNRPWKFRRQIALGVFPSAKMSMYNDLDTTKWDFNTNEAISSLFTGNESSGVDSPFADDYEVDEPNIESKVPYLIADADSSQFSTIVDIIDKKNLAVEGPPGSGKSQTIVNTIAAALLDGKKVLFVAEKTAALDVVKSRLEALNLGEFILPLLGNRSGRIQIIESIRKRLDSHGWNLGGDIKSLITSYRKYRAQINEYIGIMSSIYAVSEFTTHDVLGKQLLFRDHLERLPKELQKHDIPNIHNFSDEKIKELFNNCEELEEADIECLRETDLWKMSNAANLNPFAVDEIIEKTSECADVYAHNSSLREQLSDFYIRSNCDENSIYMLLNIIKLCENKYDDKQAEIVIGLLEQDNLEVLNNFITLLDESKHLKEKVSTHIQNVEDENNFDTLSSILDLSIKYKINNISNSDINSIKEKHENNIRRLQYIIDFINECMKIVPNIENIKVSKLFDLCYISSLVKPETLAFRNEKLENPLLLNYLKKQHAFALKTIDKKDKLSHSIDLESEHNPDEIRQCLNVLSNSGIFRFLNSNYHRQKKYYKSISINNTYDLDNAIINLRNLSEIIIAEDKINNDDKLKNIFEFNFDGINTNFQLAFDTIKFYKDIEDNLSNTDERLLCKFLRTESASKIKELPKPDLDKCQNLLQYGDYQSVVDEHDKLLVISNLIDEDIDTFKNLISIIKSPLNISLEELKLVKSQISEINTNITEVNSNQIIKSLLGENLFFGIDTDISYARNILELAEVIKKSNLDLGTPILKSLISKQLDTLKLLLLNIQESDKLCIPIIDELAIRLECDVDSILKEHSKFDISEWAKSAINDREGLVNYSKLASYKLAVSKDGFSDVVKTISDSEERFDNFTNKVKSILFNNMAKSVYSKCGDELGKFNGMKLNKLRQRLAKVDREVMELTSYHIANELIKNTKPKAGIGRGPKRDWTELSLINNEVAKKQRFVSPRDLTRRAGKTLLELKPCWMMSPLSVAQYIQKGDIEFDLVIIDEASQMTPENAIGAIVRSKQTMIVGDTNQLPPTNFFKKFIAVDEDDEEDSVTEESILEIANGAFRPARRLRWHYRSRHSSLIAFSNEHIYNKELTIFPSATEDDPTMGVSLVKVDGIYSSGTNPKESEVMIEHIIRFMNENTDRSLGVVTVNQKQRDLLLEEFEYAISKNPSMLKYIKKWDEENSGLESFFIKNLENVQGDERDVIFIGTVYGPETKGARVMQRFGPISGLAGRRRLNVLFTRAKKQIVTFSSMTGADITAEKENNPGTFLLKEWLNYSATHVIKAGVETGREPDSEFEEYVIKQIESIGCIAVPQVGVSGYFIDIGVRHPQWPHGYILGVECDGAAYHSSKSARDRDRLREEILTNLGWEIYRIWSTDWFGDPKHEADKLRIAIDLRLKYLTDNSRYTKESIEKENVSQVSHIEAKENIESENVYDLFDKKVDSNISINTEQARELLLNLRTNDIAEEFDNATTERGILNDEMIKMFLEKKPETLEDFRRVIPISMREKIDYKQMGYLNTILDTLNSIG